MGYTVSLLSTANIKHRKNAGELLAIVLTIPSRAIIEPILRIRVKKSNLPPCGISKLSYVRV